jgi:tetratricopeptide (TPR) repeat protein
MKLTKYLMVVIIASLVFTNIAVAQFDDDDDEFAAINETVQCIPEDLSTPFDSLSQEDREKDIRLLYNFGYEYYKNKNYKAALPYLWKVFNRYNPDTKKFAKNAIRKIANIYYTKGIIDSTLLACYRGLEKFETERSLHHYAGLLQDKLGRAKCAVTHYEFLANAAPNNADYLKKLAWLYFNMEDTKAVELQKKVVELLPDDNEAKELLIQYTSNLVSEEGVLELLFENWKKNPENMDYALQAGKAAAVAGEFEKALPALDAVIQNAPTEEAYMVRAEVYENTRKYSQAVNDYKKAIELNPENVDNMLKIAENYKWLNQFSKAKFWINKTLNKKRGYGKAYIAMGELFEAAVPYCQKKIGRKSAKMEDKLMYEKALKMYKKAQNDPAYKSKAKQKTNFVQPLLPTQEDRFMNQNAKIKSQCYQFAL